MTDREIIIAFIAALPGIIGLFVQWRRDRNKPRLDVSESKLKDAQANQVYAQTIIDMANALQASGKNAHELFDELAEIPQLRSDLIVTQADLKIAQNNIKALTEEVNLQRTRANFFINFARENWNGAHKLYSVIKMNGLADQAEWVPVDKFPTGPLAGTT